MTMLYRNLENLRRWEKKLKELNSPDLRDGGFLLCVELYFLIFSTRYIHAFVQVSLYPPSTWISIQLQVAGGQLFKWERKLCARNSFFYYILYRVGVVHLHQVFLFSMPCALLLLYSLAGVDGHLGWIWAVNVLLFFQVYVCAVRSPWQRRGHHHVMGISYFQQMTFSFSLQRKLPKMMEWTMRLCIFFFGGRGVVIFRFPFFRV